MRGLSAGIGLGLSGGGSGAPWHQQGKADGVNPSFWADFINNRYAVNGIAAPFADVFTFTRASAATYFDASGVMQTAAVNTPRFNYNPATLAAEGLLIEEQRTNLQLYSVPTTGQWNTTQISYGFNTTDTLEPKGTNDASKATCNTASASHCAVSASASFTSGTAYTLSCFVKAGTVSSLQLTCASNVFGFTSYANFNLTGAGSVTVSGGVTSSGIQAYANGWYRIQITLTASSTASGAGIVIGFINSPTASRLQSFVGLGTETFYIWGAQVEVGSFPTSYIPTTTAAVTRSADTCLSSAANVKKPVDWISATGKGTCFSAYTPNGLSATLSRIYHMDNDGASVTEGFYSTVPAGATGVAYVQNNVDQAVFTMAAPVVGTRHKLAHAADTNTSKAALQSTLTAEDTSVALSTAVNRFMLGNRPVGDRPFNGTIGEFRYYPIRALDATLQTLTA